MDFFVNFQNFELFLCTYIWLVVGVTYSFLNEKLGLKKPITEYRPLPFPKTLAKGQSHPQELKVGPRSRLNLLVSIALLQSLKQILSQNHLNYTKFTFLRHQSIRSSASHLMPLGYLCTRQIAPGQVNCFYIEFTYYWASNFRKLAI